jgi:hypothetical protein
MGESGGERGGRGASSHNHRLGEAGTDLASAFPRLVCVGGGGLCVFMRKETPPAPGKVREGCLLQNKPLYTPTPAQTHRRSKTQITQGKIV